MRIQKQFRFTILLICFLFALEGFCSAAASPIYGEYWQYFNGTNWERGPYRLYTIGEMRYKSSLTSIYYYRIAANFAYQVKPYLDLEAHYSYIYNKSEGAARFSNVNRLELEVNPSKRFENGIALKWRSRLELLKQEGVAYIQFVFRDRLMVQIPIKNCGRLTSIHLYDEVFYDFKTHRFTQNRFVPLELSFALNQKTHLEVFFMVRNYYSLSSDRWYRSLVLGSALRF